MVIRPGKTALFFRKILYASFKKKYRFEKYYLKDDGVFPNNRLLPVLFYKAVLQLPPVFPARYIKNLFEKNGWSNSWKNGIFTFQHYHSNTHEVMGVYKGKAILQLGGESGIIITIEKGDVLLIPAGVAHKNLEKEKDLKCVGAYPFGKEFDMQYGKAGERPATDKNIKNAALPLKDPVFGSDSEIHKYYK
jgi:uncharacterized protein YjlB